MSKDRAKLLVALGQWRDSLVNLSGRNRLLNYRPTRSSTIEFARHTPAEVYSIIGSRSRTYVMGTKPAPKPAIDDRDSTLETGEQLEQLVLEELAEFNYAAYEDQLFCDIAQRDVDRALKNLNATATREFLDKGLRTLYLALGAIRWKEESGESRVSPLVLIPIELERSGPREPLFLSLAEDDISVNPALAIKFAEHGIEVPSAEAVIQSIDEGGIEAALSLFRSMKLPEGWAVEDMAVLSTFMFAKEAMYRDLLENESRILDHPLLSSLAGVTDAENSSFTFDDLDVDEIDDLAAPESTPLILDADSSQRVAILAAKSGQSFVLDGPPGTGKSQTIANMIGDLISAGKTVLFVSEKVVALDVVRDRLSSRGLGHFLLELHSHKAVRSEVANRIGAALDSIPVPPPALDARAFEDVRQLRQNLSDYAMAMNERREPLGLSVHQVMGRLARIESSRAAPAPDLEIEKFSGRELARLENAAARMGRIWSIALAGPNALWFGYKATGPNAFAFQDALESNTALREAVESVAPVRDLLGLTATTDASRLLEVLKVWNDSPPSRNLAWLLTPDLKPISAAIARCKDLTIGLVNAEAEAMQASGPSWEQLPCVPEAEIPQPAGRAAGLHVQRSSLTSSGLESLSNLVLAAQSMLAEVRAGASQLATTSGLRVPDDLGSVAVLVTALKELTGTRPPRAEWILDRKEYKAARKALPALRDALADDEKREAAATTTFTPKVLELDLDGLAARFGKNRSWYRRLSPEFRADKAALARTTSIKLRDPVSQIQLALDWKAARDQLAVVSILAGHFGDHFQGRTTDWDGIQLRLDAARLINNAELLSSKPAFLIAMNDELVKDSLRAVLKQLDGDYETLTSLQTPAGDQLPAALKLEPFKQLMTTLAAGAVELAGLSMFMSPFATLDEGVSLETAVASARSRNKAYEAGMAIRAQRQALEAALMMPLERVESAPMKFIEQLEANLKWSFLMRKAVSLTENSDDNALSEELLDALDRSPLPPAFPMVIAAWEQKRNTVVELFDASRRSNLELDLNDFAAARALLEALRADPDGVTAWAEFLEVSAELRSLGVDRPLAHAISSRIGPADATSVLLRSALDYWVSHFVEGDIRLSRQAGTDRSDLAEQFRVLDRQLAEGAIHSIVSAAAARRPRSNVGQAAVIRREAEKKRRHLPVRELMDRARDVIQAIQPCFMMSPLAVSQYLPADIQFDVVIFDEASQVSPGDAINCIYRGKALITAGDQKQLPPTSFFAAASSGDDDEDAEEDLAADFESILDLMKSTGNFNSLTLRWHYRSRHEHLITYSNSSFYGGMLITFPGAIADSSDLGVKLIKANGIYRRSSGRDNPVEAQLVAQRVIHHFETRPGKSLGVVAFSATQRDTIENAIDLARSARPDLDGHFETNRTAGFFVKSLESVQGDERDVIIFSVGYGPDENSKIFKNFGPLNRAGGERRLNVAITRAKELVEIVTSMTAAELGEVNGAGPMHLRRYLDFAERGIGALALELGDAGLGTDSPFEDSVIDAIRGWGYEVQPQVGAAGFRIDIGVKHPNSPGAFMLGVECDGAMYHSSRAARDRDRLRHEILEGLGWKLHHIWGTAWYRNRTREEKRLLEMLEKLSLEPVTGRLGGGQKSAEVAIELLRMDTSGVPNPPDWVQPYLESKPSRLRRRIDLSDSESAFELSSFVDEVVASEAPVHFDLLSARLREVSGIGRVGSRIQTTLEDAITFSSADFDGTFLRANPGNPQQPAIVRKPSARTTRSIDQVAPEELGAAILGVVTDARGATQEAVISAVADIFGWRRRGPTITSALLEAIQTLSEGGRLQESAGGIRPVV